MIVEIAALLVGYQMLKNAGPTEEERKAFQMGFDAGIQNAGMSLNVSNRSVMEYYQRGHTEGQEWCQNLVNYYCEGYNDRANGLTRRRFDGFVGFAYEKGWEDSRNWHSPISQVSTNKIRECVGFCAQRLSQ